VSDPAQPVSLPPGTVDTEGMFAATAHLPEQVAAAAAGARGVDGLPDRETIENVVVFGMGGSGMAGDILRATAGPFMAVPVVVIKSYTCPAFVGDETLVFAMSFSGNTEETLEAVTDAAMAGARVVAVTHGGELAKLASAWGTPVIGVPDTIPQPRAALGALAIPPMIVLEDLGLFPGASSWIAQAVDQLRRRRDQLVAGVADGSSPAAALARRIGRTTPLIYGGGAVGAAAAMRWKTQINENAKMPAFWNTQPELSHNEICGWGQNGDITRQLLTIVNLRHDGEHPQVARRFQLLGDLVQEVVAGIEEVRAEGEGDLAQLLDLILFGDFVSLHLAAQEGIDPGPVPVLTALKQHLSVATP
jgi:glucose/mannose-6-phosphate isomerase